MSITTLVDKKRVFVAMSGGVDSSVAAALLKKRGFDIVGIHMRCYNVDGCAEQDAEDARRAAEVLGIPFYVFDFEQEYKKKVVDYMVSGYKNGITPNPDVMCNKEIKFGLFFKKAMEMGADYVATGHYARLREFKVKSSKLKVKVLATARDLNKDQSYFLWAIKPEQLERCLFPIGEYKKPQVRKLAAKFGLLNAAKKDSQGICFLGKVSLPDFLTRYIRPKAGAIINDSGKAIGEHRGAHFYTIGQRRGLQITNNKRYTTNNGDAKPHYVVSKNVKKNLLVVAEGENHPALYRKQIDLTDVNLFQQTTNDKRPVTVYARVRYRQPLERAKLNVKCEKAKGKSHSIKHSTCHFLLKFDRPIKFVAPGQSAVFYDSKGAMLGGGIIKSAK